MEHQKKDVQRYRRSVRYTLVGALIAMSALPFIFMLPILGDMNFLFLFILWPLFLWAARVLPKSFALCVATFCAIALTVPPYPNYLSITAEKRLHLSFIGFKNVLDDPFGLSFFFCFYLSIFIATVFLIGRRK
jgi:hypothetical protein